MSHVMALSFDMLNNTNYAEWCRFMQALLTKQVVWGVVSDMVTCPQGANTSNSMKAWVKKNNTALSEMILMLTLSQLGHSDSTDDSHRLWTALENVHCLHGLSTHLSLCCDFFMMSKHNDQTMISWITDICCLAFKIKDIGATVTDENMIIVLPKDLPAPYKQLVVTLNADELTVNNVVHHLVNEKSHQAPPPIPSSSTTTSSPTAFASQTIHVHATAHVPRHAPANH